MRKIAKQIINPYQWEVPRMSLGETKHVPLKEKEFIEDYLKFRKAKNIQLIQSLGKKLIIYFEMTQLKNTFGVDLYPGKYILKFEFLPNIQVEFLEKVSQLNLIPKIYTINKDYFNSIIIMDYFEGIDLEKLQENLNWRYWNEKKTDKDFAFRKYLWDQIVNEYSKWEFYKIKHNDLNFKNILVSKTGKVIFIDPLIHTAFEDESELIKIRKMLIG